MIFLFFLFFTRFFKSNRLFLLTQMIPLQTKKKLLRKYQQRKYVFFLNTPEQQGCGFHYVAGVITLLVLCMLFNRRVSLVFVAELNFHLPFFFVSTFFDSTKPKFNEFSKRNKLSSDKNVLY